MASYFSCNREPVDVFWGRKPNWMEHMCNECCRISWFVAEDNSRWQRWDLREAAANFDREWPTATKLQEGWELDRNFLPKWSLQEVVGKRQTWSKGQDEAKVKTSITQLLRKFRDCHSSLLHLKAAACVKEESRKEPEKGKGAESGDWSINMALSHSLC